MLRYRELTASAADLAVLERFYSELYLPEFPDPNERESLGNMRRYLELKAAGWYGTNNYHILILQEGGAIIAGSVSDYLAAVNVGVIEFLVVSPARRNQGVGRHLLQWTEQILEAGAGRSCGHGPECIAAEMNDPFKQSGVADNQDPFLRAAIWGKWGYKKIDFPYVQPALSSAQDPVHHLLLMAKPLKPELQQALPADLVGGIVREYMRWAMRIDEPEAYAAYREMNRYLETARTIPLIPLLQYAASQLPPGTVPSPAAPRRDTVGD